MNAYEQCEVISGDNDGNGNVDNCCSRQKRNVPDYFTASMRANGNPFLGSRMQLFSKSNYNLAIYPDGIVKGTMDDDDPNTHLQLISAGMAGHLRMRGIETNLYVAMNESGHLYGEADISKDSTIFIETFQGSYNTYLSFPYASSNWFIGIRKSGEFKPGPETGHEQTAVMFLPRRSKFE